MTKLETFLAHNPTILGNIVITMALVYTLVINGILTVWADESGIGFSINTYQNPCDGNICD
jgi:hypothetical protein